MEPTNNPTSYVDAFLKSKDSICALCQDKMDEQDFQGWKKDAAPKIYRTACNHFFHTGCVMRWDKTINKSAVGNAKKALICPVCRGKELSFKTDIEVWKIIFSQTQVASRLQAKKQIFLQIAAAQDKYYKEHPDEVRVSNAFSIAMPPELGSALGKLVRDLEPVLDRVTAVLAERGDLHNPLFDCCRHVYAIGAKNLEKRVIEDLEKVRHLDFIIATPEDHAVVCRAIDMLRERAHSSVSAPTVPKLAMKKGAEGVRDDLVAELYHQQKIVHDVMVRGEWFFRSKGDSTNEILCSNALTRTRGSFTADRSTPNRIFVRAADSIRPGLYGAFEKCASAGLVHSQEEGLAAKRFIDVLKTFQQKHST